MNALISFEKKSFKAARIWSGVLLLLFLLSLSGLPLHHHHNGADSGDCPICLTHHQPQLTNHHVGPVFFCFQTGRFISPDFTPNISRLSFDLSTPRAPPSV
jgi:hypothetical protein